MRIDRVTLTADDPDAAARWYADTLGLPASRGADGTEVTIGASVLALRPGDPIDEGRAHHLAFSVDDARFTDAADRLAAEVPLMTKDGSTVIAGPPGWNSRSVYFWGPDGAVLELIARADLDRGGEDGLLDISEVALGVTDARDTAARIGDATGLVPFTPVTDTFLPVGDQHGLLILTDVGRTLLPTESTRIAEAPVEVDLRAPRAGTSTPTPHGTLRVE